MNVIDLFSGIGGFALAFQREGFTPIAHSEVEEFSCKVYHHHFPESKCLGDITKIDWKDYEGADIITGGFPCQPHSIAGKRKGSGDERDLWSECVRAIRGVRPRYALFENVPALLTSDGGEFFNRVLADISESGYDAEWEIISAADFGAPHLRERIWIIAYPNSNGEMGERRNGSDNNGKSNLQSAEDVGNAESAGRTGGLIGQGQIEHGRTGESGTWDKHWYEVALQLCHVDDGLPDKLDKLGIKAGGNAIVPQVAKWIARRIKEVDSQWSPLINQE